MYYLKFEHNYLELSSNAYTHHIKLQLKILYAKYIQHKLHIIKSFFCYPLNNEIINAKKLPKTLGMDLI